MREMSSRSMKFPVAPQSIMVVVLTIWLPTKSLIGMHIVLSLGKATSTWFTSWEDDVKTSSQVKNSPGC